MTAPAMVLPSARRAVVPASPVRSVLQYFWKNNGKNPAITVVANDEFAQSYNAQANTGRFLKRSRTGAEATRCA